jgi:hypothetical protein
MWESWTVKRQHLEENRVINRAPGSVADSFKCLVDIEHVQETIQENRKEQFVSTWQIPREP